MVKNNGVASEEAFESKIQKLYGKKCFIHQMVDSKQARNKVKSNPSDWVVTIHGITAYAEVKSFSDKTSFPFSNFTKGQMNGMTRQTAAGGKYWIFIHHVPTDKWYWIDSYVVLSTIDNGKKSLSLKELENFKWKEDKDVYRCDD